MCLNFSEHENPLIFSFFIIGRRVDLDLLRFRETFLFAERIIYLRMKDWVLSSFREVFFLKKKETK